MKMQEFASENNHYYIEVRDDIVEVPKSSVKGAKTTAKQISKLGNIKNDFFSNVGSFLTDIANEITKHVEEIKTRPDEIEMELNLDASIHGDVCVVSSDVKSAIKVRIKWMSKD